MMNCVLPTEESYAQRNLIRTENIHQSQERINDELCLNLLPTEESYAQRNLIRTEELEDQSLL